MIKFNWGTGITIFLAMFLLAAFYFIYFSFQHHNDLVVDDYYEQGANFDDQILINKRSFVFSDSIKIENQEGFVTINVAPSIAAMTDTLMTHFYFPSNKKNDYRITVTDLSQSAYIDKNLLTKGRYTLKFSWYSNGEKYMTSQDFFVTK